MFTFDDEGKANINGAAMQRLRMEIDSIKWYAAKLSPKIMAKKLRILDLR